MKKIEAIIRPAQVTAVREALHAISIYGMTIIEAIGLGRQEGYLEIFRGNEYQVDFLSKVMLIVVVEDDEVNECIEAIKYAARTGKIGDGKIFVTPIEAVHRIRTGEKNKDAV